MFLRLILIFLVIYFIYKLVQGITVINVRSDKNQQSGFSKREGEIHVDYDSRKKEKIIPKDHGEYVDYEEL